MARCGTFSGLAGADELAVDTGTFNSSCSFIVAEQTTNRTSKFKHISFQINLNIGIKVQTYTKPVFYATIDAEKVSLNNVKNKPLFS